MAGATPGPPPEAVRRTPPPRRLPVFPRARRPVPTPPPGRHLRGAWGTPPRCPSASAGAIRISPPCHAPPPPCRKAEPVARVDAAAPGSLAGMAAAVLFLAGALKSVPQTAALPDITVLSAGALAVSFPWLLASRRWTVLRPVALPLAAAGALWLWMVLAATWSSSAEILSQKLPEAVLLGPAMLAAGMATGADAAARRWLVATAMLTGPFVAAGVAWGLASGDVVLGGLVGATDATRVQYQLAGLAMACGAGLATVGEASRIR